MGAVDSGEATSTHFQNPVSVNIRKLSRRVVVNLIAPEHVVEVALSIVEIDELTPNRSGKLAASTRNFRLLGASAVAHRCTALTRETIPRAKNAFFFAQPASGLSVAIAALGPALGATGERMKMKNLSRLTHGLTLVVAGLQVQACGGDDEPAGSSSPSSNTPTSPTGGTQAAATGGTTNNDGTPMNNGGASNGLGPTPGEGTAVNTEIPSGSVEIDGPGLGTDAGAEFEGYFWTSIDSGGSTIAPREFQNLSGTELTENKICVNGEAAQVMNDEWGSTWGAEVGWNILSEAETIEHTRGIEFTIEAAISSPLRFQLKVNDTNYCVSAEAGKNSIMWDELATDCWGDEGDAFDVLSHAVSDMIWTVPSTDASSTPFDFCVGGLTVLTEGGAGGAGGSN